MTKTHPLGHVPFGPLDAEKPKHKFEERDGEQTDMKERKHQRKMSDRKKRNKGRG